MTDFDDASKVWFVAADVSVSCRFKLKISPENEREQDKEIN